MLKVEESLTVLEDQAELPGLHSWTILGACDPGGRLEDLSPTFTLIIASQVMLGTIDG